MRQTVLGLCVVAGLGVTGYLLAGDAAGDKATCKSASLAAKEGGGCCGGAGAAAVAGNANYKRANELLKSWREAPTRLASMTENEKTELEASFKKLAESHPMVSAFEPTMVFLHKGLTTLAQIDTAAKQLCEQASAPATRPAAEGTAATDATAKLASAEGQMCPKTAAAMASATSKMKQSAALTAKANELMLVAYKAAHQGECSEKADCTKSGTTAALASSEGKAAKADAGCSSLANVAELTAAAQKSGAKEGCCGGAKTTAALASGTEKKEGGCCSGAKSAAALTAATEKSGAKEGCCGGAKTTATLASGTEKKEGGCCSGAKSAAALTAATEKSGEKEGGCGGAKTTAALASGTEKKAGGCCSDGKVTAALASGEGKPCVKTLVSRGQEVVAQSGPLTTQWQSASIRLASMDGTERESVVKLASTVMASCPIGSRMPETMETVANLLRDAATLQAQAMSECCHNPNLAKMIPEASKELAKARLDVLAAVINVLEKSNDTMKPAAQVASAQ